MLAKQEMLVQSPSREYPLEKEMATHSNTLAEFRGWRIGGLWSMGLQSQTRLSD